MPFSFVRIEKEKSRVIAWAFGFLVLIYLVSFWVIALLIKNYPYFESQFSALSSSAVPFSYYSLPMNFVILAVAVMAAVLHWLFTVGGLSGRIVRVLGAKPPDLSDPRQVAFKNIIEEVSVATGGVKMEGMIIPSLAANACVFYDGEATPVIAVTSGLLFKLNRAQLEAVVGHEAAHIVRGDCEQATVISSMFEIYSGILNAIKSMLGQIFNSDDLTADDSFRVSRRGDYGDISQLARFFRAGPAIVLIVIIVAIMFVVNALATLMRLFISRERESRADAQAVRLTRDPLSLAEALYIIAFGRRRFLSSADFLETLFIVNPNLTSLDEETGLFSDMFSTHPPITERIKVLTSMAHAEEGELQAALKASQQAEQAAQESALIAQGEVNRWFVANARGEWIGPLAMERIVSLDWAKGECLSRKIGENKTTPLSQVSEFMKLKTRFPDGRGQENVCPGCGQDLADFRYERISVQKCPNCEGIWADEESVGMILYRKEATFPNDVQAKAATLVNERIPYSRSHIIGDSDRFHHCRKTIDNPRRLKKMFFNRLYMVEVDRCLDCGLIWFDKDELELLECIYELRQQALLPPGKSSAG